MAQSEQVDEWAGADNWIVLELREAKAEIAALTRQRDEIAAQAQAMVGEIERLKRIEVAARRIIGGHVNDVDEDGETVCHWCWAPLIDGEMHHAKRCPGVLAREGALEDAT